MEFNIDIYLLRFHSAHIYYKSTMFFIFYYIWGIINAVIFHSYCIFITVNFSHCSIFIKIFETKKIHLTHSTSWMVATPLTLFCCRNFFYLVGKQRMIMSSCDFYFIFNRVQRIYFLDCVLFLLVLQ